MSIIRTTIGALSALLIVLSATGCGASDEPTETSESDQSEGLVGLESGHEITDTSNPPVTTHRGDPAHGGGCTTCGPVPDPWKTVSGPVPDPWSPQPSGNSSGSGGSENTNGTGSGSNKP